MFDRVKSFVERNWVWLLLFTSVLFTMVAWRLFHSKTDPPPDFRIPGKAEVDAAIEQRRIQAQIEQEEKDARRVHDETIRSVEKELKKKKQQANSMNQSSERKVADEVDRRL